MARDEVFARRTESGIQISPTAQRLRWELSELVTSDGHVARGAFTAAAPALGGAHDLRMLEEALLGSRAAVSSGDVTAYFANAIVSAARKFAGESDAKALLGEA